MTASVVCQQSHPDRKSQSVAMMASAPMVLMLSSFIRIQMNHNLALINKLYMIKVETPNFKWIKCV